MPPSFVENFAQFFDNLSSDKILSACKRGLTQNQNESINGILWSKCPKRLFCGKARLTISVCETITYYNEGALSRKIFMSELNLNSSVNTTLGLRKQNTTRIRHAKKKTTEKYKKNDKGYECCDKTK